MPECRGTVVITGGTRGLGRALSLLFAGEGYEVWAIFHSDEQAARLLEVEAETLGYSIRCLRHDITREGFPQISTRSEILFIHCAAATFQPTALHLIKMDDFSNQWHTAVGGFLHAVQAFLRPMAKAGRGTIVSVLTSGLDGLPPRGFSAYVSAKMALMALTRSVASEYGARGIRTFSVSPGFMSTEFTRDWDPRLHEAVAGSGMMSPVEVAKAILQLVSDPATPGIGENHFIVPPSTS